MLPLHLCMPLLLILMINFKMANALQFSIVENCMHPLLDDKDLKKQITVEHIRKTLEAFGQKVEVKVKNINIFMSVYYWKNGIFLI